MTTRLLTRHAGSSAANGQVKNLAEKPLICNMAARLDAMTGSSSTTKMHERGDTWGQFLYFSGALGCRGVIYNQYVPRVARILVIIAQRLARVDR